MYSNFILSLLFLGCATAIAHPPRLSHVGAKLSGWRSDVDSDVDADDKIMRLHQLPEITIGISGWGLTSRFSLALLHSSLELADSDSESRLAVGEVEWTLGRRFGEFFSAGAGLRVPTTQPSERLRTDPYLGPGNLMFHLDAGAGMDKLPFSERSGVYVGSRIRLAPSAGLPAEHLEAGSWDSFSYAAYKYRWSAAWSTGLEVLASTNSYAWHTDILEATEDGAGILIGAGVERALGGGQSLGLKAGASVYSHSVENFGIRDVDVSTENLYYTLEWNLYR